MNTMGEISLNRSSDGAGIIVALALHAGVVALLLLQPGIREEVLELPERMTVNLATEVSLESTAPDPVAVARAASAPIAGEAPTSAPDEPERAVAAENDASPTSPNTRPPPTPTPRSSSRPDRNNRNDDSGSDRFNNAFNQGMGDSSTSNNSGTPANELGPSEMASLEAAVGRAVKRRWQGRVPQGPDAEKLVTRVFFKLNPDGTLAGEPRLVGQTTGVTASNRNQVGRHREEAVRAIKLVGRFNLPFDVPRNHPGFTLRFDRN